MINEFQLFNEIEKKCVLLVDDEPSVLNSFNRLLKNKNYDIITAMSGDMACEILERQPVHVIITDSFMPGMSGNELLAWARQRYPNSIRILMTGCPDITTVMQAVNTGEIYRFFLKPLDPIEAKLAIKLALDKYDLEQECRMLLRTVQKQSTALKRLEAEFPGITLIETDAAGAVEINEITDEELAAIKKILVYV